MKGKPMINPTNLKRKIMLLSAVCVLGITTGGSVWAFDTSETMDSEMNPDFAPAQALVDAGKYDEALTKLQTINAESPDNADVLNLIGFSLRKTGHPKEALEYYNKALTLMPAHLGANEYLGELYLELRQTAKAKERLEVLRQACGDCEEFRDLEEKIQKMASAG
jgi:predicted Zn-dependent protease